MKKKCISWLMAVACLMAASALQAQAPHPERIYLSGTGIDDTRTWEFKCSDGMNSGKWKKIEVPCNWELQGFGAYTYGRWYKVPGEKPSDETGIYRHKFSVPQEWNGKRVKIVFDGVMTDVEVSINGQSAGPMHQGGFYRFNYDITDLLKPGKKNTLEVKVAKESANRSINAAERKADWWLFGGIYRPVWLEVVPQTHMRHFVLDANQEGKLRALVEMEGEEQGYSLALSLRDLKSGESMLTAQGSTLVEKRIANPKEEQLMEIQWQGIKPWDTEHPQLYVARLELKDAKGNLVQARETRVGFRTVEFFPQDGLYLNGTKLIVKGINRHSFSPDGGRATSAALSRQDALLIKEMNMNAVRSHYPPDEHFLDMCDSLGIVYMDELAGWQNGYDSQVGPGLIKEMIERDVNHPCIVIWSHGNEGGWNEELDHLFARHDKLQKRHMVHPWADFNDLDTHHYPAYLTGVARFTNGYKVFMPTEFMHAMYDQGGGAGMRDFWDRWLTHPMFAGGFIWVYCDEAPKRTDKGGILDSDKSNAPDGVVGPRREKEGSFYAIRAQWSPIQLKPLLITSHFDGSFLLTNEYLFTNLKDCRMTYRVHTCDTPLKNGAVQTTIAQGAVTLPAIAPGETGRARFALPENFREGDVLQLDAFDKEGHCMNTWTFPIKLARQYFEQKLAETPQTLQLLPSATATERDGSVWLTSEKVSVEFDAATGIIRKVMAGGEELPFKNGPVAVGMKMRYEPELSYVRQEGGDAIYCAKYKGAADSIVWRLTEQGLLYMDAILLNRASGGGGFDDAFMDTQVKNLGFSFSYPEASCSGLKWMGRGPYRVWKNRIAGTDYGIWQKAYNNTITGESFENLIYPEFKGYHANMYWATIESPTAPFTVYSRNDGIFYHIFTPEEPAGRANGKATMPAFPEGDLSFLLDIPAICSFKPIEQQGPNSQSGNIRIKKGDEGLHLNLMFDFRK
ncbi:MAG: beta-galactosidase [Bacteroides sp.]|nr:beta-galactosidase [Bacteroides sp.]